MYEDSFKQLDISVWMVFKLHEQGECLFISSKDNNSPYVVNDVWSQADHQLSRVKQHLNRPADSYHPYNYISTYLIILYNMQNLFQGGECAPGVLNAQSNNFKRLMDLMMMGNQNPEKLLQMTQSGLNIEEQIMAREMIFQQMNKAWAMEETKAMMEGRVSDPKFAQQKMQHEMIAQKIKGPEFNNVQQMMMRQQMMAQTMMHNQMAQAHMMQMAHQAQLKENQLRAQEASKEAQVSFDEEQERIKNAASSMLDSMMDDPDPRFKNSKFLHFLKQINAGDLVIQDKEIIQKQKTVPDIGMETAWDEASKQAQADIQNLQKQFVESERLQSQFDKMTMNMGEQSQPEVSQEYKGFMDDYVREWQNRYKQYEDQLSNPAQFQQKLQQKYLDVLKEMDISDDLTKVWKSATDMQQQQLYGEYNEKYIFDKNNPYLSQQSPVPLALNLMNKGKNNEAILALESALQKDQNNADHWRLLGKLLQENDQDQKSVPCFLNALKIQPTNLDTLLALGVSCTNTLDEVKAMNYLKHWMINNPKFKGVAINPNIIPEEIANQYSFQIQDIKKMNSDMIEVFKQGLAVDPNDSALLQSLAVLHFIRREYEVAVDLFTKAVKNQPTNYTLWNRVGASLAHLGRPDEAIECYHKALQIRPNYVRAWVNLGIAHGFKGLNQEAARFYLNALSFRPDAKHLWAYLQTCFMSMQRYDLIKLIASQDPKAFKQFDVIQVGDLPEPSVDYTITNQNHIISGNEPSTSTKE